MKKLHSLFLICILFLSACSGIEKPAYGQDGEVEVTEQSENTRKQENGQSKANMDEKNYIRAKVANIVDGDTLSIQTNTIIIESLKDKQLADELKSMNSEEINVRYLAVDTPEITKGKDQPYGTEAKELVEHLLQDGEVILEIDPHATFDNYGRLLAHVFTSEGESVQLSLLQTGVARVAYLFADYKYVEEYKAAEQQAIKNNLNIHSIEGYVTEEEGFREEAIDTELNIEEMTINDLLNMLDDVPDQGITDIFNLLF